MKKKRVFSLLFFLGLWVVIFVTLTLIPPIKADSIPKEATKYNQKGNEFCDKGEFEKGVKEYEKAVEIYPNYIDAIYNLSMTYYLDLKNYAKAIYYIKRFLQAEGEGEYAEEVNKWLEDAEQKLSAQQNNSLDKKEDPRMSEKTALLTSPDIVEKAEERAKSSEEKIVTSSELKTERPSPEAPKTQTQPGSQEVKTSSLPPTKETKAVVVPQTQEVEKKDEKPKTDVKIQEAKKYEEAKKFKDQGNEYNRLGKSEEAVKAYLKALQIYPEYTDALYNIAKTYDFDLKNYNQAIYYYKGFLKYEHPTSRDSAQVKVWLARVEQAYRKENEKAKKEPLSPSIASSTAAKVSSKPEEKPVKVEKKVKTSEKRKEVEVMMREKVSGFITKGLTSSTLVEAAGIASLSEAGSKVKEEKANIPSVPSAITEKKKTAPPSPTTPPSPKPLEVEETLSKKSALSQEPNQEPKELVESKENITGDGEAKEALMPGAQDPDILSPSSDQLSDGQQIIIETVIPKNLIGSKWVPLSMQKMQDEIVEVLAQNKAKSPEKLAELYLSRIQSDIRSSGEKVSYFKLEEQELADLPYMSILTEEEKRELEKEKWELIRTRKSPARLREVLTILRNGYKIIPH